MTKDERLYARFDIGMPEHPKVMLLSDAAFRVLIESTMYCRRQITDGFLDERIALKMWGREAVEELASNHPDRPSLVRVEGGWQIRDYAEHQITRADIQRKRDAGRAGGLAKAKRAAGRNLAPATEVLGQNPGTSLAKTETETETETETATSNEVAATRLTALFDQAYEHWPKKVERKAAFEKFRAATKKLPVSDLVTHITRFGDAYAATTERQFTPALGVWISHERWTDELPSPRASAHLSGRSQTALSTVAYYASEPGEQQRGIAQ